MTTLSRWLTNPALFCYVAGYASAAQAQKNPRPDCSGRLSATNKVLSQGCETLQAAWPLSLNSNANLSSGLSAVERAWVQSLNKQNHTATGAPAPPAPPAAAATTLAD